MSEDAVSQSLEFPSDLGTSPKALARRWKLELELADKREKDWRKRAKDIYEQYTPSNPEANSFNILWSNTETLRQAVYNSTPEPQCKRRYSDDDPLGLKTSEVLTRALSFSLDCSDFNVVCQKLVLSMLLPGRAIAWERYVPKINSPEAETSTENENEYEEIEWEQVVSEKVHYDDFRILCGAKTWDEVTAIGRRHNLSRHDLIAKFGEDVGNRIKLDAVDLGDNTKDPEADLFKTAEVWEIWDKETKQVIFINSTIDVPCKVEADPLELDDFFPTPRPLYAIENDSTLDPACLYTQYEQQAKELNRISARINKLVDALRVRGVYDGALTELSQLMKQTDNNFIPAQNARALIERGGLEKAIWMMPIDMAAMVLKELYIQRDATKQIIYEISGISDIMRSASDPKETFGAQKIKTQWGTQRLQRMQREVQRYIRDMIRIKAEIICKKFQPETLEGMTLVKMPHQAEVDQRKQMMLMQYQQAAIMAQQQGQQPPPPPQMPPDPITWEAVIAELKNDVSRAYRIDIETDSTLASTQDEDMDSLKTVIGGIVEIINGFAPAVQAGAIPIDTVKALIGVVVRRAKLGSAVEDAIGKIVEPVPQVNPDQVKAQAEQQKQAMIAQQKQQEMQLKLQHDAQLEHVKMQAQVAKEQAQAQGDAAKEQYRMQADAEIEQVRTQMQLQTEEAKLRSQYFVAEAERNHKMNLAQVEQVQSDAAAARQLEFDKWKAELESATKICIAELQARVTLASKDPTADTEIVTDIEDESHAKKKDGHFGLLADMHGKTLEAMSSMVNQMAKPKRIVRDSNGKAQGIE